MTAGQGSSLMLTKRRPSVTDNASMPLPWKVSLRDGGQPMLRCSADLWEGSGYVVGVHGYGYPPDAVACAIRMAAGGGVRSRADLVAIAAQVTGPAVVPVELYPADDRVVDVNSTYVWGIRDLWTNFELEWIKWAVRSATPIAPGIRHQGSQTGPGVLCAGFGDSRNWADIQTVKSRYLSPATECLDVLLPWTVGQGAVLFYRARDGHVPLGWKPVVRPTDRSGPT